MPSVVRVTSNVRFRYMTRCTLYDKDLFVWQIGGTPPPIKLTAMILSHWSGIILIGGYIHSEFPLVQMFIGPKIYDFAYKIVSIPNVCHYSNVEMKGMQLDKGTIH
jgi:hypothetical protein